MTKKDDIDRIDKILKENSDETGRVLDVDAPSVSEMLADAVQSINRFPRYVNEADNPDILVKGRWLERGGSAWWISTAGTGKSIASIQLAYKWAAGKPFANLYPYKPITSWIIQSEDSPSRIVIDREDIVAELNEQEPDVDWCAVAEKRVLFVRLKTSISGVRFFKEIGRLLDLAKHIEKLPDLLIINPFLAFVGGPVTDGSYVTPFLRGGDIHGEECFGMQPFLEKWNIAALFLHHTPKPPNDKEIALWLKSSFPEYQGAGSSEITNWGRSFITAMKCPGHHNILCLCAGKNGSEIGWNRIGGSPRHYIAWSKGQSITGGSNRHAWRDLDAEEYEQIVTKQLNESERDANDDAKKIAEYVRENKIVFAKSEIENVFPTSIFSRKQVRLAKNTLISNAKSFGIYARVLNNGRGQTCYIGWSPSAIETRAKNDVHSTFKKAQYDALMKEQRDSEKAPKTGEKPENKPNVEGVGATDDEKQGQSPVQSPNEQPKKQDKEVKQNGEEDIEW